MSLGHNKDDIYINVARRSIVSGQIDHHCWSLCQTGWRCPCFWQTRNRQIGPLGQEPHTNVACPLVVPVGCLVYAVWIRTSKDRAPSHIVIGAATGCMFSSCELRSPAPGDTRETHAPCAWATPGSDTSSRSLFSSTVCKTRDSIESMQCCCNNNLSWVRDKTLNSYNIFQFEYLIFDWWFKHCTAFIAEWQKSWGPLSLSRFVIRAGSYCGYWSLKMRRNDGSCGGEQVRNSSAPSGSHETTLSRRNRATWTWPCLMAQSTVHWMQILYHFWVSNSCQSS